MGSSRSGHLVAIDHADSGLTPVRQKTNCGRIVGVAGPCRPAVTGVSHSATIAVLSARWHRAIPPSAALQCIYTPVWVTESGSEGIAAR